MVNLKLGAKNVFRKKGRTIVVLLLIAVSVAVFLSMLQTSAAVSQQSQQLSTQFETLVEIRAQGATGMGRGAQPITEDVATKIEDANLDHVTDIEKVLYVRTVDNSREFSVAVIAGVEPGNTLRVNSHGEVGTPRIIAGRNLKPSDQGKRVAVVGKVYAEQRGIGVGDTFTVGNTKLRAVGIFSSGFTFGDNQVFVPLTIGQQIGRQLFPDEVDDTTVSKVFLKIDSVENVEPTVARLEGDVLAEENVDILTGQNRVDIAAQALRNIRTNAFFGSIFALVVAALVVLFTMVLVTIERTGEIGVQKAIGASNRDILTQFAAESFSLAILGSVFGYLLFAVAGEVLATRLLGLSATSLTGAAGMGAQSAASVVGGFGFTLQTVLYAIVAIVVVAVVGSLYPTYRAVRLSPAEAMRHE
ncbi:MAG: ABC transporter permease [Candidatus Nanohaloarchaea archaeon]|nr:ABC transporter permease [Candidatus Nanohaloarchaea archaeon]